jgi:hypothetical protein
MPSSTDSFGPNNNHTEWAVMKANDLLGKKDQMNFRDGYEIRKLMKGRLCGLVVRAPGYRTEMYCASCEVLTEFIYVM